MRNNNLIKNLKKKMRKHNGMRPQDIVILLKIICLNSQDWRIIDLSKDLYLSLSEVSEALNRCQIAGLLSPNKKEVFRISLLNFLIYGLRHVFPTKPGAIVRGIPTAHSTLPLSEEIVSNGMEYVWEDSDSEVMGQSIEPLYNNVIKAVKKDNKLHELLALVDALRVGRAREFNMAKEMLKERFTVEQSLQTI
jgi:hypothetical protein